MRDAGTVASARGLLPFGHLCWAYTDRAELLSRAAEYLIDGIHAGQRVQYIADASGDELRAELAGLDHSIAAALANGDAGVLPLRTFCHQSEPGGRIDPPATVAAVKDGTRRAIADGYTGYRAVVDCTALSRTPAQRDLFAGLEHRLDRLMATLPLTAMCGYDAVALGETGVAEMACLHPFIQAGDTPFRLYAADGVAFALAGEVDLAGQELFATTLRRILPTATESKLVIDGRALGFIGHRALMALDAQAAIQQCPVLLRDVRPIVARVARLLPLRQLTVEAAA